MLRGCWLLDAAAGCQARGAAAERFGTVLVGGGAAELGGRIHARHGDEAVRAVCGEDDVNGSTV